MVDDGDNVLSSSSSSSSVVVVIVIVIVFGYRWFEESGKPFQVLACVYLPIGNHLFIVPLTESSFAFLFLLVVYSPRKSIVFNLCWHSWSILLNSSKQ